MLDVFNCFQGSWKLKSHQPNHLISRWIKPKQKLHLFSHKRRSSTVEPVLGTLINHHNMKRVNSRGIQQGRNDGGFDLQSKKIPAFSHEKTKRFSSSSIPKTTKYLHFPENPFLRMQKIVFNLSKF